MLNYVVVDLDHTLIASGTMERAWEFACAAGGIDAAQASRIFWQAAGTPAHRTFENLGFDSKTADTLTDIFWTSYEVEARPLSGAQALLNMLNEHNIPIYLSTGSHPEVLATVLDQLKWHHHFALTLGTDRACEKGQAHYAQFIQHAGVDAATFAAETCAVGDGVGDMTFARDAGIKVRCGIGELAPYVQRLKDAGATHVAPNTAAAGEFIGLLIVT